MPSLLHLPTAFPQILYLSFFAPLVLRVFLAGVLFLDARHYWDQKERWWLPDGVALVIGVMLLAGYAVQVAAILGIGYLAFVFYDKDRDSVFSHRPAAVLALAIFLVLLVAGAGAFALDLPY